MYETSDFKKGLKIMVEGNPYVIVDFQHVKPGKGKAQQPANSQPSPTAIQRVLDSRSLPDK